MIYVVGPPKCGTTALDSIFRSSNLFDMPSIKETNFLSSSYLKVTNGFHIDSEEKYYDLFENNGLTKLEVCPSYFYFLNKITFNEDDKLIICLRDPLKRSISHYFMDRDRFRFDLPDFNDACFECSDKFKLWGTEINPYSEASNYSKYLPNDNNNNKILYVFIEDGIDNVIKKINNFLKVNISSHVNFERNEQKRLRYKLIGKFWRTAIAKRIYILLPIKVRNIFSDLVYDKKISSYTSLANELYDRYKNQFYWNELIKSYIRMKNDK